MKKLMFLILALILTFTLITRFNHEEWSYEKSTGPEYWGELDSDNAACSRGTEQSPINLEFSRVKEKNNSIEKQINYEPTLFTLQNNGHTIQANATTEKNNIIFDGNEYKLVQFHFHTPSEHQFNGENFAMEVHLVHKDNGGNLAVLGLMIQEGEKNKALASIWDELPKKETRKAGSEKFRVNLQALLPKNLISFHYDGSLTTPPCTEKVEWIVFEQPIEMSKAQIKAFQKIFTDNHRPVQPLNERDIIKN